MHDLLLLLPLLGAILFTGCGGKQYPYPEQPEKSSTDQVIESTYRIQTLEQEADYEGPVVTTLYHLPAKDSTVQRAVLHVHGWGEYFFQPHLGTWFAERGYNFYAIDLRKAGRSWLPHQKPHMIRDHSEYFEDLDAALRVIKEEDDNEAVILLGHSNGGLLSSLYCAAGAQREYVDALILNSPFLEFAVSKGERRLIRMVSTVGGLAPGAIANQSNDSLYSRTLHADFEGEWAYSLDWKPLVGFPVYVGFIASSHRAHKRVKKGLDLSLPVLVMHSDSSYLGDEMTAEAFSTDTVLDVDSLRALAPKLGDQVDRMEIQDCLHDLFLSQQEARDLAFRRMETWLNLLNL